MISTLVAGMADFPRVPGAGVTMRPGGPGRLVRCLKCPGCGFSIWPLRGEG